MNEKSNRKRCIITFGKYNKYIIVLFIGGFIEFICDWIYTLSILGEYSLIRSTPDAFSMSLVGIFIIYYKCKGQKDSSEEFENSNRDKEEKTKDEIDLNKINNEINVIKNKDKKIENKRTKIKYILIFINSFIYVTSIIMLQLLAKDIAFHCIAASIISMSLFGFLFFKHNLYRHHFICIIFIALLSLGHDIIDDNIKYVDSHIIFKILFNIFWALHLTLIKYIMETYFITPYEACFWHGNFSIILIRFLSTKIRNHYTPIFLFAQTENNRNN